MTHKRGSFFFLLFVFVGFISSSDPDNCGSPKTKYALLAIDVQGCFLPGGSLAVPGGEDIIPLIREIRDTYPWDLVVYSQDTHPPHHVSFASSHDGKSVFDSHELTYLMGKDGSTKLCEGGSGPFYEAYPEVVSKCDETTDALVTVTQTLWPDHCVESTSPSLISRELLKGEERERVVYKGTLPHVDSYSAFFDNLRLSQTSLHATLQENEITDIFVVGLARDYCVFFTAIDGASLGYNTFFVWDATRGISPDTEKVAMEEMLGASISIIHSHHLPSFFS